MFRVIDKSDSGKTRKLLEECSKNNGLFVCSHPDRIYSKCLAYGVDQVNACGYTQYIYDKSFKEYKVVYIDDLDKFLYELSIGAIRGYVITVED